MNDPMNPPFPRIFKNDESLGPLNVEAVGLYITACAAWKAGPKPNAMKTIQRRLSALSWYFHQRGLIFDRRDPHIATIPDAVASIPS